MRSIKPCIYSKCSMHYQTVQQFRPTAVFVLPPYQCNLLIESNVACSHTAITIIITGVS